ncbi:hypothetical protein C8F01DRAFT_1310029 [Mycena amicta]|nr:hypothetical protein C8F01DRAFT_1310029 [Mycena amicta]
MPVNSLQRPSRRPRSTRPSTAPENPRQPLLPTSMLTLQEDEPQPSLNINLDTLPPPFPPQLNPPGWHSGTDWATFITAYACGRWDPQRIPRPPISQLPEIAQKPVPSGALAFELTRPPPPPAFSSVPSALPSAGPSLNRLDAQTSAATLRWAGARVRVAPLSLPSPEHELVDPMRNAGAVPIPGSHPYFATTPRSRPSQSASHSRSSSRSYTNVPHFAQQYPVQTPGWDVMTPGGTRRARLSGFWSGTVDVEQSAPGSEWLQGPANDLLPTLDASPTTPEHDLEADPVGPTPTLLLGSRPPPATAPVRSAEVDDGRDWDYFALGAGGSKTSRHRRVGLSTPPSTRDGSTSRRESEDETPRVVSDLPKEHTPTTPDSNPKRPALVQTSSAPTTSSRPNSLDLNPPMDDSQRPELHVAIVDSDVSP